MSEQHSERTLEHEIGRVRRVADMLCTAHAALRDRYSFRAFVLDLLILALSIWLVALAFIEPRIGLMFTPFGLEPLVWAGLLGVFTAILTVFGMRVDWRGRSEAHSRSLETYAQVKREAGFLLTSGRNLDPEACREVLSRNDMASAVSVPIPEADFLGLKRRHLQKLALSRYLDTHPSAWIWWISLQFWIRDNFGKGNGNHR